MFKEYLNNKGNKLWLVGMFSAGKLKGLKEVVDPIINNFNGVVATFHLPTDETSSYLESIKGEGEIIYTKYVYRNDLSRNLYLWQGPIKNGDWFINIDNDEELKPLFFEKLNSFYEFLISNNIDGILLHGKRFMFRYNDFMEHKGNPHEGLFGANRVIELTKIPEFSNSEEYFVNLRPIRRDKFVFIDAYLRYYLSCPNSNQCLLGTENNIPLFQQREQMRREFRLYVQQELNIDTTVEAFKQYIDSHGWNDKLTHFCNNEKIINDWRRYHYLNDRNFNDDHDRNNMIKFD